MCVHLQTHTLVHANVRSSLHECLDKRVNCIYWRYYVVLSFLVQRLLRQPKTAQHKASIVREAWRARWGSEVSHYLDAAAV